MQHFISSGRTLRMPNFLSILAPRRSSPRVPGYYLVIGALLVVGCAGPTEPEKNYLEMERVWQYLRAFCIWQDQVPTHPFNGFDEPGDLTDAIQDTIKDSRRYTVYYPPDAVPRSLQDLLSSARTDVDTFGTVLYQQWSSSLGYLRISSFEENYTASRGVFRSTFDELSEIEDVAPNVIIDLRGNGGGVLDVLDSCMELFLPAGVSYIEKTYRYYNDETRSARTRTITQKAVRSGGNFEGRRYAVLIDTNTASAAEIFAAGLRDGLGPGKVTLIGKRTFGKAIGQYYKALASQAVISITAFRFRRVLEDSTEADYMRVGIPPDRTVANNEYISVAEDILQGTAKLTDVSLQVPPSAGVDHPKARGAYAILHAELPESY